MKQTLIVLFVLTVCTVHSQTLFTYGNKSVSREAFLRAFNKNNNGTNNNEKAYRDYLELFIRFKLKVQAGEDAKLDTLPSQKTELQNFRNQIADGFMNDEASVQLLVEEAFNRSQKDIRIAHIYIPYTGTDTLSAFKKAMAAYSKLQSGADFTAVANIYSEDPSVHTNNGDIGFITCFSLPYDLESLAYSTATGKFSKPYKSKTAYHIFKITAERPAFGKMKVKQILLTFVPGATDAEKERIRTLADSVYQALEKGASFKDMVAKYSNDNISYNTEGLLPEFGIGRYSADFENAAFGLNKDGAISKPVLTGFGYHILQRVEHNPVVTDKADKKRMAQLEQSVKFDKRIQVSKQVLAQKILKSAGYKKALYIQTALDIYLDSLYKGRVPKPLPDMNEKTLLFTLHGQKLLLGDFVKYYNSIRNTPEITRGKSMQQLLQQYTESVATEYYRNHMELFNKEFAYQLNEFKEGNLLFEIMQQQVWDKAAKDSIGLKKYYYNNKNKYWWESSADVILFTCSDSASAADARSQYAKAPTSWRTIVQNANGAIQADSGRFEITQLPITASSLQKGFVSAPAKAASDNSTSFAAVINLYKERTPRNFEEARGFVINDYQAALEEKWILSLRKKYPVKVNQAVLQSCWK